jgi:PAS domain S-box-containing protein
MEKPLFSTAGDFRRLVDLAPDGIIATDSEGLIVLANARSEEIFGYTVNELVGQPIELLLPVSLREEHERYRAAYLVEPRMRPMGAGFDLVAMRKDGSEFAAEVSLSPIHTSGGMVVVAAIRDITKRKLVAAALEESREWLNAIFQASRDGIIVEEDEHIVYANRAFAHLYGYDDLTELMGKHVSIVQATESNDWMLDLGRRRLAGEPVPWLYEFKGRRKDGTPIDLEASVSLSTGGEKARIITVVRDIAERKRAERERARLLEEQAARREAEAARQRWAFLADASAVLSSSLDYEATLAAVARLVVPAFADWCVVQIVREDGEIHTVAVAHREPGKARWATEVYSRYPTRIESEEGAARAIRTGQPQVYEHVSDETLAGVARSEEHLRLLREVGFDSALVVPLVGRTSTLGAITLVSTDPSHRLGQSDLVFAEELASRAALAIDNARLYEEAQEASRLKDEFLATLSHELRTPLNAMLGWARLLRNGELDQETAARAIDSIERNTQAQSQLVSDILDVSRIITGKLRLELRPLELGPVVDAALDAIRPAAVAKGVDLKATLEPSLPLSGDADRLLQVVWNLLSNAVKFTPRGGSVSLEAGRAGEHAIEIAVQDTGVGISRDFVPYVFDRFRQGDASTTRAHGGLGLGLAIVRHLVELHGGSVEAHSGGQNQGARFTVRLPAAAPAAAQAHEAPAVRRREGDLFSRVSSSLDGVRILVVDDEADTRELVKVTLRQYGATVVTAPSVEEALDTFDKFQPQVVFADIAMPGKDGYSLVRQLRALPEESGGRVPVIALTAYARNEDRARALSAGFDAHLAKPAEPAELAWTALSLLKKAGT